jgi:beta-N-acetylhexosaminidase
MAQPLQSAVLEKFIVGFEGTTLPAELKALLEQGLCGVAIFPRNFSTAEGLRSLIDEIRHAAGPSVVIGIDQEGGWRFALPEPFTQWPSATELGFLDDPVAVKQVARCMGQALRSVGCNLDFAPMLDLHLQSTSPVTADRSFGSLPNHVARLGEAFIRGLAAESVLACAKHFPGHGDAQIDPHMDLPIFDGSQERLKKMEFVPFARAVAAEVPMIMTAHILLPKIDAAHPASLSKKVLHGLLREHLSFRGVILADDLGMGAIHKHLTAAEAAVETFQAGTDVALLCHDWPSVRPAIDTIEQALRLGQLDPTEWAKSHERIAELRSKAASAATKALPLSTIGCAEHRAFAAELRERIKKVPRI